MNQMISSTMAFSYKQGNVTSLNSNYQIKNPDHSNISLGKIHPTTGYQPYRDDRERITRPLIVANIGAG